MKLRKHLRPAGLIALGVFLGRGAYADTTLDFNADPGSCTPPQVHNPNNPPGITNFGSYAAVSSGGVTVSGFGTPNIGLDWSGSPWSDTRWEYYNDGGYRWSAVQLQGASLGSTEMLTFVPDNAAVSAVIKSFNFHPYYFFTGTGGGLLESAERFTFDVSVTSGPNVLFGPTHVTFRTDATKNHPVSINYTGAPGQPLRLRIKRVPSVLAPNEVEGNAFDIAADDIVFAQTPTTSLPAGPQVVSDSVSPHDGTTGFPGNLIPPYAASITNGDTTVVVPGSIQLKLDGALVSPSPTISTDGVYTNVSYAGATAPALLSTGSHLFTLTYADNLGAHYTNETEFSALYSILPPTYAMPPGSGSHSGFTWRSVLARQDMTNGLDSSIARAVAQLNGTLVDPDIGGFLTNAAPTLGTNADGSFNIDDGTVNFNDAGFNAGDFPGDILFPGLDLGPYNWFSCEGLFFLDLPAGYYRFGVNSDDGFEFNALPPKGVSGSPIVLGVFDGGRGSSDTLFDFLVPTSGVYPFQLIYFESTGGANCELFSVDVATTNKFLINDLSTNAAIKSFIVVPPRITNIARSGSNVSISWVYGNPPFQVQFKNNITGSWSNSGAPTSNRSALVPIQPGAGFFRVVGSP
jgi:hypothetical protein